MSGHEENCMQVLIDNLGSISATCQYYLILYIKALNLFGRDLTAFYKDLESELNRVADLATSALDCSKKNADELKKKTGIFIS